MLITKTTYQLGFQCTSLFTDDTIDLISDTSECVFWTRRFMEIFLTQNSTIVPNDEIQFLDVVSLAGDVPFELPFNHTRRIPVEGPIVIPVPVAVISGPTDVGLCNAFTLSARLSRGDAGRGFTYAWTISPPIPEYTGPLDVQDLNIPSNISPGTYEFTLEVDNTFATSQPAIHQVVKSGEGAPLVNIIGEDPRNITRDQELSLFTNIELDECIDATGVLYEWVSSLSFFFSP